ncbi:MAG: TIGR01777 family oxidoreductase [Myxococcota bacterium]
MTKTKDGAVLLSGATGLVGSALMPKLLERFESVRALSRSGRSFGEGIEGIQWDGLDPGREAVEETKAVIHLSGEPLFGGLPTAARMESARKSRVESTRNIVDHMASLPLALRPRIFVCASAVGYYGNRGEERLDEEASPGEGLLADLCQEWEAEAQKAEALDVRVVRVRIGVVLAESGGALGMMKIPFKLGVGGRLGSGRQFFPWIHLEDLVETILWSLTHEISGPVNGVAPEAVRNIDLTKALGEVLGRPTVLPVPSFALKLALGPLADELLGSRRVVPERLVEAGYPFRYPTLVSALEDVLR